MASNNSQSPSLVASASLLSTSDHTSPLNNSGASSPAARGGTRPTAQPLARSTSVSDGEENFEDFLTRMNYLPILKSSELYMSDVQMVTNKVMGTSKAWEQLDAHEQAKMAFLVLRNQQVLLSDAAAQDPEIDDTAAWVAEQITSALSADSLHGRKLESFLVRKGGTISEEGGNIQFYPQLVENFEGTTIFNHPDEACRVEPFHQFQERDSTVCYFLVAISTAIFYSMRIHTGTKIDESSVKHDALNVDRFKRNEFPDEEVCLYIFGTGGGYAHQTVARFLGPFNQSNNTLFSFLPIQYGDIQQKFVNVDGQIRDTGALVIRSFPLFQEYLDKKQLHFSGHWNDMNHDGAGLHALIVVGVRLTSGEEDMGGMEFLIQDSWEERPFFTLGYDLLSSMGINEFLTVREGVSFSSGQQYNTPHSPNGLPEPSGLSTFLEFLTDLQEGRYDAGREDSTPLPSWWMPVKPGTNVFRSG